MDESVTSPGKTEIGVHADEVLKRASSEHAPAQATMRDDGELAEAIREELRDDSTTSALAIEVEVWDRVVHLRGVVAQESETEAAENVAARVDGVGLVADDLEMRRADAAEITNNG